MAKMKAHPKTFEQAEEVLTGGRKRVDALDDFVRIGHNTYVERLDKDTIAILFHKTYIVKFHRDGRVQLFTGGWRTITTKDRLNEFISARVYQKKGEWWLVVHKIDGSLNWEQPIEFEEGIDVTAEEKKMGWRVVES